MASKQIQDIKIRLGIEGFEGLDRIKGSFRELAKVTNLSDKDISRARDSLVDFAKKAGDTQQASKGLIDALKGLQAQATRNSSTYNKLSEDIIDFNQSLRVTDAEIQKQAELLAKSARAHTQSEASIKGHVKALQDLRTQASLGGQAYIGIGAEIDRLNTKLEEGTKKSRSYRSVLGQALSGDSEKLSGQLEKLRQVLADAGNTAEQTGRAMAQLAVGGATESRNRIAAFTKEIEEQRRAIARLDESFLDLPKTPAIYAQRLSELNLELNNSVIASGRYYEILSDISTLQLELQRAQAIGRGQVLFERLSLPEGASSRLASTQRNLGMVIGALREEMSMLDTSTAEGSAKFAQQSRQVAQLEEQLKKLENQYVSVGQSQAAAQQGINPYGPSGARNPLYGEDIAQQAIEGVKEFRETYNNAIDNLISAKATFRENEARLIAEGDRQQEQAHLAEMDRSRAEFEQADRVFKKILETRTSLLELQKRAAASAMGLGGRELSPLYERITGLAGASVQREQLMMGRSATQVLTDMLTAFEKGGRGVNIKQKSTEIGESIAQGVANGASDKNTLISGANNLSIQFIASLKKAFKIKSPSQESRDQIGVPIGEGIGQGIIQGLKAVKGDVIAAVRVLFSDIAATPQKAGLPPRQTSDLADKLQSFLARSSSRTSAFLPFARLMGEDVKSSPALTLAAYRKAYERGGIVPSMYMPAEQRRAVRGVSGLPGYGLEQEIISGAVRNVGRTGAFVGPLAGPRTTSTGIRSVIPQGTFLPQPVGTPPEFKKLASALAKIAAAPETASRQISGAGFLNLPTAATGLSGSALNQIVNQSFWKQLGARPFAGQISPLFPPSSPVRERQISSYGMASAESFPVEGMLGTGRSLRFGRESAAASTKEAISSYRNAVSNFWEGETGTFETIRRIVSSGVQLSASKLARRLTESVELPSISSIGARARGIFPSISGLRGRLPQAPSFENLLNKLPDLPEFMTGEKAFLRSLNVMEGAYGAARLGGFPIEGMARIGNVPAGGGSFVPMAGAAAAGGGGGGGRPPAAVIPPAAPSEYQKLTSAVKRFGDVSRRSTSDLRDFAGSLTSLQDILDPTAADFKQVNQEIERQNKLVGRELQRRQPGGRRGLSGMQLAQGVGAAISGGIFGGPEGLIGGLGGLAVGGVGGAFAGAAFGAQVGGLRQQLGGFAEYAAQIQKLEIALENTAGSQAEFNRAIKAASDVTKTLNVPQEVAISGMTRLSAAVKGAGGQISDAELVFKNVTAAIKGTGGAAQDVDGSVTALVQIFSKGKVSAEEINQIAERLPGTFNLIAEASGRTGPELSKALEQGAVGLDDLMKFIVELGNRYSEVAQKISASSQDAGARLTVAFNSMRQSVGKALQPIGAEFQEAFADFVENITPFLAENLPKIAGFVLDLSKNLVPLAGAIGGVAAALAILNAKALLASGGMTALASAIGAANLVALVNPYVALAAGVGLLTAKLIGAVNKQRELNNLIKGQGTLEQFNNRYQEIEGQITAAQEKLTGQTGRQAQATRNRINQLKSSLSDLEKVRGKFEQAVPEQEKITPSDFPDPTGKDSGSGRAKKERESQLPQLLAELAVAEEIARVNEKIREAQLQDNQFLQIRLEGEKNLANIAGEIRAIAFEKIPADEAEVKKKLLLLKFDESRLDTLQRLRQLEKENTKELTSGLDEVAKKYKEQREKGSAVAEMVKKGITPALAEAYYEIDKTYEKEKERIQLKIEEQKLAIAGLDVESKVRKEIEKQIENLEKLLKLRGQKVPEAKEDAAAEEERKRREKEAEEKAQRLKNLYGGIVSTIEDGIVGSFTAGIESLIEGTKTLGQALQEIASGVLKDIGQLLLRFGVNAGLRAVFPGAFAEKGAYFASGQASFAKNSIQPFAMGGIVTKPTFFKYADGGTFNNGVMGEAGPEAIMPLKRGLDGKLGVAARLDGALKRYRPVPGSAAAVAEGAELTTGSSAAGATAIDVRYNVERINNVDYVTNQEFQAGLQQAASQGAERGQQLALRRLQQSVTTRRRLGI
jgi:tape measure domain-containing protein